MDLIDRKMAKEEILYWAARIYDPKNLSKDDTMYVLDNLPAVDAVEVVRCKDCVRRNDPGECPMCFLSEGDWDDYTFDDGYCDRGERKGGERR